MGTLLSEEFRKLVKGDKDLRMSTESQPDVGYPIGFPNFDFMNGYIYHVNDNVRDIHDQYYSLGISNGSMVMIIGRSGCGKSTFCIQVASNIVRPFKTSCIFEDSVEGGMIAERREQLSGFHGEEYEKRFIIRNTGVNAENFYKRIKMIHDMKINNPDDYMYDTGKLDGRGNPIRIFEPTVYILDSLAMIMPDKQTEEDELSGSMAVTATAKIVTDIMRRIIPMLKIANIILLVVNHVLDDASIKPKKSVISYLNYGEVLPRGKTAVYLCNTLIRLDDTKMKSDEKFKIAGSIVNVKLCKSRSAIANRVTPLLFSQVQGFIPELSLFLFLQEQGRVHGAGLGMYFDDNKDFKFSYGNFLDKITNNKEYYKIFLDIAMDELKKLPTEPFIEKENTLNTASDIYNNI